MRYRRGDLAHLKWSLITQKGLSKKEADEHIQSVIESERRDKNLMVIDLRNRKKSHHPVSVKNLGNLSHIENRGVRAGPRDRFKCACGEVFAYLINYKKHLETCKYDPYLVLGKNKPSERLKSSEKPVDVYTY